MSQLQSIEAIEKRLWSAADLLRAIRQRRADEERAAADQLVLAAAWADLHPPESIHDAASFAVAGWEHEEPIAGEGAPLVAEFCVAELGGVLGMSTTSAKSTVTSLRCSPEGAASSRWRFSSSGCSAVSATASPSAARVAVAMRGLVVGLVFWHMGCSFCGLDPLSRAPPQDESTGAGVTAPVNGLGPPHRRPCSHRMRLRACP